MLVNGAGTIGRFAIQSARHAGAHVTAITSPRSAQAAEWVGAHSVNPATPDPIDALIHLVPETSPQTDRIRPGGVLISATTPATELPQGGFRANPFIVRNDPTDLAGILALTATGRLRIDIAARRPVTDLPRVHEEAENGHLPGKTLLGNEFTDPPA
ncbi:zinc-binding dehydrogenase [Actinoplanes couchii]|uniref:Alcohol dehydrogenase-like C-terminal domain-containing protein n=1 Tax=Actinoplanes couchii TaxID=403638 RepID=A0ABQ3X773_9ACTN|nr:zinc-binding dehydrogenase [Actinoplanes couchii]MDR6322207.1 D-arabinose 1-dehydrogenase-like Zn-dependent alcohol dehydrogenase [Actinoplanes couchii]GID54369.1 hypothetical protein Aco03nite_027730 [Actinoplanes couchii]